MKTAIITVKDCYALTENLFRFLQYAGEVDSYFVMLLNDIMAEVKSKLEEAEMRQKELQKKYPFKWTRDLPGYKKGNPIFRVFSGDSADKGSSDEIKASRALIDEKDFNKTWEKYETSEKCAKKIDYPEITKEDFRLIGSSTRASITSSLYSGMKILWDYEKKEEEKKKAA